MEAGAQERMPLSKPEGGERVQGGCRQGIQLGAWLARALVSQEVTQPLQVISHSSLPGNVPHKKDWLLAHLSPAKRGMILRKIPSGPTHTQDLDTYLGVSTNKKAQLLT